MSVSGVEDTITLDYADPGSWGITTGDRGVENGGVGERGCSLETGLI